jgi:thiosulfate/3-mercaptopyruvate sulfurtransferase
VRVLVAAEELLGREPRPVLLDVRWALGDDRGRERYLEAHLRGAVFVDLEAELADPPSAERGRHPLPSLQRLQDNARRWGIRSGDRVVVYDDTGGAAAARAWWLLRWAGLDDVALLDGGIGAWRRVGGAVEAGEVVPEPGDVVLTGGGMPTLTLEEAAALPAAGGLLLDARAGERYRGEVEPIDPRAGHVPGAVSAPTTQNLADDGTFLPAAVLKERFGRLGAEGRTVGVYCGSGVTAAHEVVALAEAGIDAALWPGSWSQWSADPGRPAATGPDPG